MNRYKKANEGIHAPGELKEKAAHPAGKRSGYRRWAGAVAAVLAVVIIGGIALRPGQNDGSTAGNGGSPNGEPAPYAGLAPGDARSIPDGGMNGGEGNAEVVVYGDHEDDLPMSYKTHALAMAEYPEMHPYPKDEDYFADAEDQGGWDKAHNAWSKAYDAWWEDRQALRPDADLSGVLDGFLAASSVQFLTGADGDNRVYSPLNVYMALSMLAETAGENSRAQILDLLDVDSIDALRTRAYDLWRDSYRDDGTVTSILANSLWLSDDLTYNQKTLDTLAQHYYASAFSGEMGSEEYDQALRDWINAQTRGLLTEQANGLEMDPATVLALASTIYFKAAWHDEFAKEDTKTDRFHTPSGDVDAEFMHATFWGCTYYWGDHFSAIYLNFQEGGSMWLILPDEGYTVDQLLESGEAMEFLTSSKYGEWDEDTQEYVGAWPGQAYLRVNLSMPKFDVSSDLDLIDGLKKLGVTDVFDPVVSNFDPLGASTDDPLFVSKAQHAARVTVDEEGCEAAAYTVFMLECGSAGPPDEEVDFTLDRPFLFAITGGWSGLPLFVGAVNQPNG